VSEEARGYLLTFLVPDAETGEREARTISVEAPDAADALFLANKVRPRHDARLVSLWDHRGTIWSQEKGWAEDAADR
jgi:hypothetical protein